MNGLLVIVVAGLALAAGYLLYGRWLARTWGIDDRRPTPAVRLQDGQSFSPTDCFGAFSHQFSSICGAGPVTGTIVAMMFGWLPVVLWVLVGGVFMGAVHDFGSLYASVRNNGKSLAQLLEKYVGRTGMRLFLLFSWLFCIIVIAAFTSMVAGTFAALPGEDGAWDLSRSYAGGVAGSVSILFTFAALAFGWLCRRFSLTGAKQLLLACAMILAMFAVGMAVPVYLDLNGWIAVVMVYLVFAAAVPIHLLKQPRDYLTTVMMVVMIASAVVGIVVLALQGKATMTAPMVVGADTLAKLAEGGNAIFPVLFVSVACGALSGFHSLVSTNTSSKQVSRESDMLPVGFGAMVLESFVGVIAVVFAAIMFGDMNTAGTGALDAGVASTPFQIFAAGIARGMTAFGVDSTVATVFMTMNVSALALTSLDAVARIARTSFQEFFSAALPEAADKGTAAKPSGWRSVVMNTWFATFLTLACGLALTFGGYLNIWPLFGASNQLLGGMTLVCLAVFCKATGRKGFMLYVPVAFLLVCTFTSLGMSLWGCVTALAAGATPALLATKGLQLVFAVLLMVLGVIVARHCLAQLFTCKAGSMPDEEPRWSRRGLEAVAEEVEAGELEPEREAA